MEAPDPLQPLYSSLEVLADVYEQTCVAIDAGDVALARALARRSRHLHATVGEANALLRASPPVNIPAGSMARTRAAMARVQAGSVVVQGWLDAESSAPADTRDAIGGRLPEDWDFAVDMLLLVGGGGGGRARSLLDMGQRRLFAYLPAGARAGELPEEVVVLRTLSELVRSVGAVAGRPPRRTVRWRLDDPAVTAELYDEVSTLFKTEADRLSTGKLTLNAMGPLWILQGAANLPEIASHPSIDALRDAFRGKPCIIASPGPSLDKNIHLVPAIRDRVLLMTSSHAMSALSGAGVVPDVCLALDAQDLRYHFDNCPVEDVNLILGATVHPDLFSLPARRIMTFGGNSRLDEWIYRGLGDNAQLPSGGSVACSALALAAEWGCDPIILIGQDLAFSGDKYYSSLGVDAALKVEVSGDGQSFGFAGLGAGLANMVEKANRTLAAEPIVETRGYLGGKVQTSGAFERFRTWMTGFVQADTRGLRFLNATEGGAYIDGMEHVSLATAIERHLGAAVTVEAAIEEALGSVDLLARKQKMLDRTREMGRGLAECNRLANDCVRMARQAVTDPGHLKPLADVEARLLVALKPVVFLSLLRQAEMANAVERGRQSKNLAQSLDASVELYEVVRSAAALLRPIFSSGATRLAKEVARG